MLKYQPNPRACPSTLSVHYVRMVYSKTHYYNNATRAPFAYFLELRDHNVIHLNIRINNGSTSKVDVTLVQ